MGSYVVKVEKNGTIRRLTLAKGEREFSYELLQTRIRDLFQLSASEQFVLTYSDKDGDVVTMGDDEDLKDALVLQALNPLRVAITNLQKGTDVKPSSPILQKGANSDAVPEQKNAQGEEQIPSNLSKASPPAASVPNGESVIDSAEQKLGSGDNSTSAEEKVSTADLAKDSNASASSATAEKSSSEKATENNSQEAEGGANVRGGHPIHFGIVCDGCGMAPLTGPRFKSVKRTNFDLCRTCFEASGDDEKDYTKLERSFNRIRMGFPNSLRRPDQRMCMKPAQQRPQSSPESAAAASAAAAGKEPTKEGTEETSTRILHQGVQCDECGVVPIEGPRFKSNIRFNYDICESCFKKSGSTASEYSRIDRPLYTTLLRMAPPQCRRNPFFGPRLARVFWVPVVDTNQGGEEEKTAAAGSDVKVGGDSPQTESAAEVLPSATPAGQDVDAAPSATEERTEGAKGESEVVQIPVINTKEADLASSSTPETEIPVEKVSTKESIIVNNSGKTAGVEETVQEQAAEENLSTLDGLLAKLAAMGFEDPKLNAELLEKNNSDLRKTLDDLCAAEEWDPILGELQEMGFYDANMNRRLMFKNKGSVKRVVKELVEMYRGNTKA